MKKSLDILDNLCKFVSKWSNESAEEPEHLQELLLEFDLAANRLSTRAKKTENFELFQFCTKLQSNLEILQETTPSPEQVNLLCAWPTSICNYFSNQDDKDALETLEKLICDLNWPASQSEYQQMTCVVGSQMSTIQHRDFLIDEFIQNEKGYSNGYSPEQQGLLDLINIEIAEIQKSHKSLLTGINQPGHSYDSLIEIIELQTDQINRIGSAAEIIGLHGLHQFCLRIQKNLAHIRSTNPNQLISLRQQLLLWPDVVQAYLFAPTELDYIQAALDYISQDCWPLRMSEQELNELKAVFNQSIIEIESTSIPERLREATPESVSLEIPQDVSADLVHSLMLDLPSQTQELSDAIQKLRNDDYLEQLEIAERIAHTLKGAGNTVGICGIANLTHNLEDILDALLKAKSKPTIRLYAVIQDAVDCLEEMSEYLQGIGDAPNSSVQIFQEVLNWANSIDEQGIPEEDSTIEETACQIPESNSDETPVEQEQSKNISATNDSSTDRSLRISAHLVDDLLNRADENIISNSQVQELVSNLKTYTKYLSINNSKIKALAQELEHIIELRGFSPRFKSRPWNKNFDPLEIDQFNELHTFANQLMETSDDSMEFSNSIEESVAKLEKIAISQVRYLRENHEAVLCIRMVPVETIVPRLKRSVRQACKLSNKFAKLIISGEQTLIDSEFLNQLVDPLMHLLRNAVDHGIESPEDRMMKGKNAEGAIQLSFKKEGNLIYVICQDDGGGLDFNRIQSKACDMQLIGSNETLTNDRAIQIILQHGFSTKDEVSQLSGRGIGLDVVYSNIREMKGSITMDASNGQGVKVEITIPTTFNSIHSLIVSCDGNKLALSNRGVEEILYPGAGDIIFDSGRHYYEFNQHRYPIFDLQTMLYEKRQGNQQFNGRLTLLIQDDANNKHAVFIDKIFDTRDIVIKPFSQFIPKISGLLGTTILGDGSVTTVIDLVELLNTPISHTVMGDSRNITQTPQEPVQTSNEHNPYILIVEDAISTRKSLAQFMRDLGFEVRTAKDGVEAIDQIQKQLPSMVLTDLEMPRMNGLELSDHLRSNKDTENTPIVMLTSRATDKHKKEAERLGVTAYITKPYDEDQLLELIHSLGVVA